MSQRFRYWKGDSITSMTGNNIFVFGSNPEGRHGLGAALDAQKFGARYGIGRGLQGNTYALVTKNLTAGFVEKATGIKYEKKGYGSVSKQQISDNIDDLYSCARENPSLTFYVIYQNQKWESGFGKKSLNGYTPMEIIALFTNKKEVPDNIRFHNSFKEVLERRYQNESEFGR